MNNNNFLNSRRKPFKRRLNASDSSDPHRGYGSTLIAFRSDMKMLYILRIFGSCQFLRPSKFSVESVFFTY